MVKYCAVNIFMILHIKLPAESFTSLADHPSCEHESCHWLNSYSNHRFGIPEISPTTKYYSHDIWYTAHSLIH